MTASIGPIPSARTRSTRGTSLRNAIQSELTRLLRPRFIGIGGLLVVLVTALSVAATFAGATADGPGKGMALAALQAPDGFVEAVKNAANLLGIVILSFAAVAVATDYGTGLIRLLVQAEPRRWRLVVGKLIALGGLTTAAAGVATLVGVGASPLAAAATDVSTAAWTDGMAGAGAATFVNLSLGLLVWASLGFVLAILTRSVAAAIAGGIGYFLIIENLIGLVNDDIAAWLPGSAIHAMVGGGTDALSYGSAVALSTGYALVAVAVSLVAFQGRDITA